MPAGTNSHYNPRTNRWERQRRGNDHSRKRGRRKKDACYVATAVYGSYDCPEVWTLRRYRDNHIAKSFFGRFFISTYYSISPSFVALFGKTKWFNRFFRRRLDEMVRKLNAKGYSSERYEDVINY